MKVLIVLFLVCVLISLTYSFAVKRGSDEIKVENDEDIINRDYVRRRRYLGISKRFKLNKRYQECVGAGDAKAHCKHLNYCPMNVLGNVRNVLDYLCVIERTHVGVCCPDDIALSGISGSQIVMDLPAGGFDYDDGDNTTGCGIPAEGRSVTESRVATIQEWPWLVAIYRPEFFMQRQEQQYCGGAIITDQHILTAAHCTAGLTAKDFRVRVGEYDFRLNNDTRYQDYAVVEIIDHEQFVLATYENDISILKIEKPMTFNSYIWPICLPPVDETFENKEVVAAGWGQVYYGGPVSPVLLQVVVPVWPNEKCKEAFLERISDNNICAAAYEGGKDSCKGDSGGPLLYQLENGRWVTIGVVSWGIDCGKQGSPGVYTRVNNYLPWIIRNTIAK